ncbi:hypothetical protein [Streptomyces bobili]|uniref:Uncharacterized protein n=1 Tax=Streptomyces bobili TaxID=67280 RepID=A0ABZ1QPL1_9ACTN|nr:hypothetical protein [Streptomyces bobili]
MRRCRCGDAFGQALVVVGEVLAAADPAERFVEVVRYSTFTPATFTSSAMSG